MIKLNLFKIILIPLYLFSINAYSTCPVASPIKFSFPPIELSKVEKIFPLGLVDAGSPMPLQWANILQKCGMPGDPPCTNGNVDVFAMSSGHVYAIYKTTEVMGGVTKISFEVRVKMNECQVYYYPMLTSLGSVITSNSTYSNASNWYPLMSSEEMSIDLLLLDQPLAAPRTNLPLIPVTAGDVLGHIPHSQAEQLKVGYIEKRDTVGDLPYYNIVNPSEKRYPSRNDYLKILVPGFDSSRWSFEGNDQKEARHFVLNLLNNVEDWEDKYFFPITYGPGTTKADVYGTLMGTWFLPSVDDTPLEIDKAVRSAFTIKMRGSLNDVTKLSIASGEELSFGAINALVQTTDGRVNPSNFLIHVGRTVCFDISTSGTTHNSLLAFLQSSGTLRLKYTTGNSTSCASNSSALNQLPDASWLYLTRANLFATDGPADLADVDSVLPMGRIEPVKKTIDSNGVELKRVGSVKPGSSMTINFKTCSGVPCAKPVKAMAAGVVKLIRKERVQFDPELFEYSVYMTMGDSYSIWYEGLTSLDSKLLNFINTTGNTPISLDSGKPVVTLDGPGIWPLNEEISYVGGEVIGHSKKLKITFIDDNSVNGRSINNWPRRYYKYWNVLKDLGESEDGPIIDTSEFDSHHEQLESQCFMDYLKNHTDKVAWFNLLPAGGGYFCGLAVSDQYQGLSGTWFNPRVDRTIPAEGTDQTAAFSIVRDPVNQALATISWGSNIVEKAGGNLVSDNTLAGLDPRNWSTVPAGFSGDRLEKPFKVVLSSSSTNINVDPVVAIQSDYTYCYDLEYTESGNTYFDHLLIQRASATINDQERENQVYIKYVPRESSGAAYATSAKCAGIMSGTIPTPDHTWVTYMRRNDVIPHMSSWEGLTTPPVHHAETYFSGASYAIMGDTYDNFWETDIGPLPTCPAGAIYTHAPVNLASAYVTSLTPMGVHNPKAQHVFPLINTFFHITDEDGNPNTLDFKKSEIYAPGDITITEANGTRKVGGGSVALGMEYEIGWERCPGVFGKFGHLRDVPFALRRKIENFHDCKVPVDGYQYCPANMLKIRARAGDYLGAVGGEHNAYGTLNFYAWDKRTTLYTPPYLINPSRVVNPHNSAIPNAQHARCFVDHYSGSLKLELEGLLTNAHLRSGVYQKCGQVSWDLDDTASGRWYYELDPGEAVGTDELPHLSLGRDYNDPQNLQVFSVGNAFITTATPGVYHFTPEDPDLGATKNLDFEKVDTVGQTVCYDNLREGNGPMSPPAPNSVFLLKLIDTDTLQLEYFNLASCAQNPVFTEGALIFTR